MEEDFEQILSNNEFIGIVEDNNDPDKKQRIKVRIPYLHGEISNIPTEHLPWCHPKRDNNGLTFQVPDKAKIVNVTFPSGNLYFPVYENAQHLNINLQKKIETLNNEDYTTFISFCYNHNTQIFVDNQKGLNLIHKFNSINIHKDFIAHNLKDNQSTLYLGDDKAAQELLLGTNWMEWMDSFMQSIPNMFIGNNGAIVVPTPQMTNVMNQYFAKRQTFLSKHIYAIDNNRIRNKEFTVEGQIGDNIKLTNKQKQLEINFVDIDYKPVADDKGRQEMNEYVAPVDANDTEQPKTTPDQPTETNEKVEKMVRYLKSQKYTVYEDKYRLNIVGIRNSLKDNGRISNVFDDKCWVFFKNDQNQWELYDDYKITTTPGYAPRQMQLPLGPNNQGVAMMVYGQFVDKWKIGYHQNRTGKPGGKTKNGQLAPEHKALVQAVTSQIRNSPSGTGYLKPGERTPNTAAIGINIHHSTEKGIATNVYNWSEGCIVFASKNQHDEFIKFCEQQVDKTNKGRFTFTLIPQSEFDNFS
jgi:hypothetical protein